LDPDGTQKLAAIEPVSLSFALSILHVERWGSKAALHLYWWQLHAGFCCSDAAFSLCR